MVLRVARSNAPALQVEAFLATAMPSSELPEEEPAKTMEELKNG
jgi:hypothetical protein